MEALKLAIIGKMWTNADAQEMVPSTYTLPADMSFISNQSFLIGSLTFRTDRNLTVPVSVKAGDKLFFYSSKKREGKQDADYSVSVLLPEAVANAVIENSKAGAEAWRQSHPVTVAA